MASSSVDQGIAQILLALPAQGMVSARTLRRVCFVLLRGLPVAGTGVRLSEGPDGREIHVTSGVQGGAAATVNKRLATMVARLPDSGALVSSRTMRSVFTALVSALPVSGTGTRVSESPHGRVISIATSAVGGATTALSQSTKRLLALLPDEPGAIVGVQTFRKLIRSFVHALPIAGTGVTIEESPHGRVIGVKVSTEEDIWPVIVFIDGIFITRTDLCDAPDFEYCYEGSADEPPGRSQELFFCDEAVRPAALECAEGSTAPATYGYNVYAGSGFRLDLYNVNGYGLFPYYFDGYLHLGDPSDEANRRYIGTGNAFVEMFHLTYAEYDTLLATDEFDPMWPSSGLLPMPEYDGADYVSEEYTEMWVADPCGVPDEGIYVTRTTGTGFIGTWGAVREIHTPEPFFT